MEVDNVTDTEFLKNVLEQLPGVDTPKAESQDAAKSASKEDKDKKKDGKKWEEKKLAVQSIIFYTPGWCLCLFVARDAPTENNLLYIEIFQNIYL